MSTPIEDLLRNKQGLETYISNALNTFVTTHKGIKLEVDVCSIDVSRTGEPPQQVFKTNISILL